MVFSFSFLTFVAAWTIHLAWWRISVPSRQVRTLVFIFVATPFLVFIGSALIGFPSGITIFDIPGMILFYAGATMCYLITYAGIEETSPSLALMRALKKAGRHGCRLEDLEQVVTDDQFVKPRIQALIHGQLIVASDEGYILTDKGTRIAHLSLLISWIFNVKECV
jgi:hypothetical protein